MASRMREGVESLKISHPASPVSQVVTISLGVEVRARPAKASPLIWLLGLKPFHDRYRCHCRKTRSRTTSVPFRGGLPARVRMVAPQAAPKFRNPP